VDKIFDLSQVSLQDHILSFKVNGTPVVCDLSEISEVLASAGAEQVAKMIVDLVGVGFHWPELDEDISVRGILKAQGIHVRSAARPKTQSAESLSFEEEAELAG